MWRLQNAVLFIRYADRVKELGVSDNADDDDYKTTPTEKEPDVNGTNDVDYSRLSNLNVSMVVKVPEIKVNVRVTV